MKKIGLVVAGCVVLIGAVVLINRERTQGTQGEETSEGKSSESSKGVSR